MSYLPELTLPSPLQGLEKGSLAEECIRVRLPKIGHKILSENLLPSVAVDSLEKLIAEIPHKQITRLADTTGPDTIAWNNALEPFLGKSWLDVPWFIAETYFYRRIISAIDYFHSGIDPFSSEKTVVLEKTCLEIQKMAALNSNYLQAGWDTTAFMDLLHIDLWGNQVDLSLWSADDRPQHNSNSPKDFLLVDDSKILLEHLAGRGDKELRIDFIVDNAAFELVGDLLLADYLLSTSRATRINLHLKLHPTFVSDATIKDVQQTIHFLQTDKDVTTRKFGERLARHMESGKLQCHSHLFWTSPHYMWMMPEDLHKFLAPAHLVISKGDANYRRSLGDVHWPHHTPIAKIISYFPAPILFLRTCKSNLVAGLEHGKAEEVERQDPDWLANGKWGLIQYIAGKMV